MTDIVAHSNDPQSPELIGALVLVYTTFPQAGQAKALARRLVEDKLAACVNVIDTMTAVYSWQGAVHEDCEAVAIIKTRKDLAEAVTALICASHPYENPAVMVIDITGGAGRYLEWVRAQTRPASSQPV